MACQPCVVCVNAQVNALRMLAGVAAMLLSRFPTTLEQDCAALNSNSAPPDVPGPALAPDVRSAIQLRAEKKAVLSEVLQDIGHRLLVRAPVISRLGPACHWDVNGTCCLSSSWVLFSGWEICWKRRLGCIWNDCVALEDQRYRDVPSWCMQDLAKQPVPQDNLEGAAKKVSSASNVGSQKREYSTSVRRAKKKSGKGFG